MEKLRTSFGTDRPTGVRRFDVPPAFRTELTALWEVYLALHAAVAGDDPDAARGAVEKARAARVSIDMSHLGAGEAHVAWMQAAQGIDAALDTLGAAEDIETQRVGFEELSREMAAIVRRFGLEPGAVYEVECPMAFERGARWLQADDEVRNPYFGASMPRCGEVVDELATAETGDE